MTDNFAKELADQSALQLWQAYCDKKMECERLHEVNRVLIKELEEAAESFECASDDGAVNFYARAKDIRSALNKVKESA